jgi:hypothetical protein
LRMSQLLIVRRSHQTGERRSCRHLKFLSLVLVRRRCSLHDRPTNVYIHGPATYSEFPSLSPQPCNPISLVTSRMRLRGRYSCVLACILVRFPSSEHVLVIHKTRLRWLEQNCLTLIRRSPPPPHLRFGLFASKVSRDFQASSFNIVPAPTVPSVCFLCSPYSTQECVINLGRRLPCDAGRERPVHANPLHRLWTSATMVEADFLQCPLS